MVASPPLSVFSRLSVHLAGVRKLLFGHSMKFGQVVAVILLASDRLRSFDRRMQSLVTRWKAGKLAIRPRKPRKPAIVQPKTAQDELEPAPLKRLPRGFGWLSDMIRPDGFMTADTLRGMLVEPEMTALIAAGPQAGRLLRPLCQMFGVRDEQIALPKRQRQRPTGDAPARPVKPKPAKKKRWRWRDIVPLGRTFPLADDEEAWAEWLRRAHRSLRKARRSHFKRT